MAAIRVLHIIESITSGGVEKRRLLMAKYLSPLKFEQKIVCTTTRGPMVEAITQSGVTVIPLGSFSSILSLYHYRQIARIIREYKPHIIHGAVFEGVTMAAVTGFFCRVPIVVLEETSDPKNRRWTGNLLLRMLALCADFVVAISPSVKDYLISNGIRRSKIRLVPNGVDLPRQVENHEIATLRAQFGLNETDFVIGTVGRLRDFHKRFSDLIKAVALVREKMPIHLLIVGDGNDRKMLEELAGELGVRSHVTFAGYQYDTAVFYRCMDVFSLASHMEGFGLVVIEAMLSQVPVVVTNVGGMKDIVDDGVTGLLVKPFSPEHFAEKWTELYNNKALRTELAQKANIRALRDFTSEAYIDNVVRLYGEAEKKID